MAPAPGRQRLAHQPRQIDPVARGDLNLAAPGGAHRRGRGLADREHRQPGGQPGQRRCTALTLVTAMAATPRATGATWGSRRISSTGSSSTSCPIASSSRAVSAACSCGRVTSTSIGQAGGAPPDQVGRVRRTSRARSSRSGLGAKPMPPAAHRHAASIRSTARPSGLATRPRKRRLAPSSSARAAMGVRQEPSSAARKARSAVIAGHAWARG